SAKVRFIQQSRNAIEIDLLQMNDERDIPAKRIPDKRYQLT
ncbi:hypothetical protein, partial [Salmonella enterica]